MPAAKPTAAPAFTVLSLGITLPVTLSNPRTRRAGSQVTQMPPTHDPAVRSDHPPGART